MSMSGAQKRIWPFGARWSVALAIGGSVTVSIAVAAASFVIGEPGEGPIASPALVASEQVDDASESAGEDLEDVADADLAITYELFLERDPFEPVVPEPSSIDGSTPSAADGANGTDSGLTEPIDRTEGTATGTAEGTNETTTEETEVSQGCTGDQEKVCDGRVVSLVDVDSSAEDDQPVASVQVDTTVYDVEIGDGFAEFFRLVAVEGTCVNVLYGDEGFRLCRSDAALK